MKDIGMNDKQFNGFLRLLIDAVSSAKAETDSEKKDKKLQKILDNLQKTLEN
mgnify:CR=1 FL=1